eukprot:1588431-Amphidinium_carterae.1
MQARSSFLPPWQTMNLPTRLSAYKVAGTQRKQSCVSEYEKTEALRAPQKLTIIIVMSPVHDPEKSP